MLVSRSRSLVYNTEKRASGGISYIFKKKFSIFLNELRNIFFSPHFWNEKMIKQEQSMLETEPCMKYQSCKFECGPHYFNIIILNVLRFSAFLVNLQLHFSNNQRPFLEHNH